MLWGWGRAEGKGTTDGCLGPGITDSTQRRHTLPAAPGFPGAPWGPWRPEGEEEAPSHSGAWGLQSAGFLGPALGQAPAGGSFSLLPRVSSSHAHTEAHMCACVSTCVCLCGHVVCPHLRRFLTAPQVLPLFALPPPETSLENPCCRHRAGDSWNPIKFLSQVSSSKKILFANNFLSHNCWCFFLPQWPGGLVTVGLSIRPCWQPSLSVPSLIMSYPLHIPAASAPSGIRRLESLSGEWTGL